MGVKRQQGSGDQKDLFDEALQASLRHGLSGDGGTGTAVQVEPQAPTVLDRQRALTQALMEEVASSANLNQAYKRVKANKGAAGVDGMTVGDLKAWIAVSREGLIASLLRGTYQPETVRGIERNRGIALERMVGEVNGFTTGWVTYFRHAACKSALRGLDEWLRRKLRCVRLKQCKRTKSIVDFLVRQGVPAWRAWILALSGKGWWRRSGSPPAAEAMTLRWFEEIGLVSLSAHYVALQSAGNRRVR